MDLSLECCERENSLDFTFNYCSHLFKKGTIKRFIDYFKNIVSTIINTDDSQLRLQDIDILTLWEKQRLLFEFNDVSPDFPKDKTLH
jgi:tyrocidine synthetase-3